MNQTTSPKTERTPMTRATLEARANQKAHDLHTHVLAVPGRPGCYTVTSSDKTEKYNLVSRDGIEGCSCKGYLYRSSCRHIEALRNRLAREEIQRQRAGIVALPVMRVVN